MKHFLCFRLYGPMAAWGEIAVGERRPASAQPSRSGVLGLIAGSLGLKREDGDLLAELDASIGFASCLQRQGELLVDYHTAQAPKGPEVRAALKRRATIPTRRVELELKRDRDAIQSWRTYFLDGLASSCVWWNGVEPEPRWSLEEIARALRAPVFVPYLGRKSCPLSLPIEPVLVDAANPVEALSRVTFKGDVVLERRSKARPEPQVFCWEGQWPGLEPEKSVRRRDKLLSRSRWQFTEREEHSLQTEGVRDVPESA